MSFFPYTVAALDLAAAGVYAYQRNWRLFAVWFCYSLATFALAGVTK